MMKDIPVMKSWSSIGNLSKSEIRDLQSRKLKKLIGEHIYPFSPFYRELFIKNKINPSQICSVDDLKRIPLTSKVDVIGADPYGERFKDFILQPRKETLRSVLPKTALMVLAVKSLWHGQDYVVSKLKDQYQPIFMTFTTGTTNRPVPFVYSRYDIENLYLSGLRMMELFGMKDSERAVNFFPYAPHLAFWQVVFGGLSARALILSTGGGKVMNSEASTGALLKMKPSVIFGVPGFIYHLLRVAKDKNTDLSYVQKVVLGAARVTDPYKIRLKNLLASLGAKDVSIFGTYGFTEARSAWVECPSPEGTSSGYHLYPDKEIFEIVDPQTGALKKEGEDGELVYTAIDARGSIVLRYRTGDFIKGGITYGPCPYCGLTTPRISSDITRLSDVKDLNLSKIKGTLVNLSHFDAVLSEFDDIIEWQIELRKKDNDPFEVDEVILVLSVREGANKERLSEDLKRRILTVTEIAPNEMIFLPLEELVRRLELETASKEKRIIDKRPK